MSWPGKNYGLKKPIYRVRWRFDFADHKPARYGIWNNSGCREKEGAWCVNKSNLLWASIEAEHRETNEIYTPIRIPGHDFVNFEFMVLTPIAISGNALATEKSYQGDVVGLSLVTSDKLYRVFIDGSMSYRERTEYEKKNLLAAWSK